MKRFLSIFLLGTLVAVPVAVIADSATDLMNFGMPSGLARQISTTLVGVNSSGNIVLPVATSKKLSVTVAGTEKASISSTGVFTGNGLNIPAANFEAVAGAGTTVADAAALSATKHIHQLTGANGTLGWKFASPGVGSVEILLNTTAGVAKIYAESGGTVNGAAADAAFSALTGIKPIVCICTATATWICS